MQFSKTIITGLLLPLALLLLPVAGHAEKVNFRIGSASMGSSGYIHWEACAFLSNKYSPNLKTTSLSTGGSTENVMLLDAGKIELAHGTSMEVYSAWEGKKPYRKKMKPWQVFSWTVWSMPMVALKDSGLKSYYDLKSKPISLIKKGSGTEAMYSIIMEEYALLDKVKRNYLSFRDSMNAIVDGLVMAFPGNFPGGKPHPIMIDLASRKPYTVLDLDLEVMKRVNKRNPGIFTNYLPKTAYQGLTKDMASPGFAGIGLSSSAVSDETIYQFTKAVFGHIDELHDISKVSDATTLENATKWLMEGYPVHPGAARYFKETGVWRDELVVGKR